VFEELGAGFIMQLLTGDSAKSHLAAPNALGEKVDLLNDEPTMDLDDATSSDDDSLYKGAEKDSPKYRYGPAEEFTARLRPLKNAEENPSFIARRNAIRIQHHALDFLRNVLVEPTSNHIHLVDQLLTTMGLNRFFEVIISKIRPRSTIPMPGTSGKRPTLTTPSTGSVNSADPNHHHNHTSTSTSFIDPNLYCHPDIVHSSIYILMHIASGTTAHRHLIMSQPALLSSIAPLFSHPDDRIRVACCWLVHNLLWESDASDKKAARTRAAELRRAGIEEEIRRAMSDEVPDVKERAKSIAEMFAKLEQSGAGASTEEGGGRGMESWLGDRASGSWKV
jgi:armadillo repeat-containing protein 8